MALWGKQDQANNKPTFITSETELDEVFGVNVTEAQQVENRAKGLKTPGWTKLVTYTDAQGFVRNKAETLVAMGAGQTVAVMGDAADDEVVVDRTIIISAQPVNTTAIEGDTATFSVTAAVTPTSALAYQWQKQEGGTGSWSNTGTDAATLTTLPLVIANDNGDKYRVTITASGAKPKTSTAVTLTVTA